MRQPRKPKARPFEKLERVARDVYNESNCCTVIALAAATGWSFGKAQAHCARHGRVTGQGMTEGEMISAYRAAGLVLDPIDSKCTLGAASRTLPDDGIYLILSTRHITCVRKGVAVDWIEGTERRRVRKAWKVGGNVIA
jgi:hypothetical protein